MLNYAFFMAWILLGARADHVQEFTARITFYEVGSKTVTGTKPEQGITAAVDPKEIPYGSTIEIPQLRGYLGDGSFVAEDTGPALKTRKAARKSGRNVPVIDIYVSKETYQRLTKAGLPEFMKV